MAETLFLKPAPGRLVFRENGTEWPEEGEAASTSSKYVRRRIKDGDLVVTTQPRRAVARPADADKPIEASADAGAPRGKKS